MKKVVFLFFCLMLISESSLATELEEETSKTIFFSSIPDRKTAETALGRLLTEEFGEASILPDKLSEVLDRLFSCEDGDTQKKCESLAHTLNSTKNDFEQQLDVLDRLRLFWSR